MRILQVSQSDLSGGAQLVAKSLHQHYRSLGHDAHLAVGHKASDDPSIVSLRTRTSKSSNHVVHIGTTITRAIELVGKFYNTTQGRENFCYPQSRKEFLPLTAQADIVQTHNLHANYFDLRCLSNVASRRPVLLTLHDAWLLSGHCAHSINCDRWKTGCGNCPDLQIYPAILKDSTAANWNQKMSIFIAARFFVATPSQWLADKVSESGFAGSVIETRVMPNGIDLAVFQPGDQSSARDRLGLPRDAKILLFVAEEASKSSFKDVALLIETLRILETMNPESSTICLAIGERTESLSAKLNRIQYVPYQSNPRVVADYYLASDVYVHPARAETFPTVILEAQACGLPIVATRVGGIPEQIEDGDTGLLVPSGDASAMANAVQSILNDDDLASRLGRGSAEKAIRQYDVNLANLRYSDWIEQIVADSRLTRTP